MDRLFNPNDIRSELTPLKQAYTLNANRGPVDPLDSDSDSNSITDSADELTSIIQSHPSLGYARHNGSELNPVNCARVLCSPPPGLSITKVVDNPHHTSPHPPTMNPSTAPPLTWADPRLPYLVSLWLQLFINIILVGVTLWLTYLFCTTVASDVRHKRKQQIAQLFQKRLVASRHYEQNKCGTSDMPQIIANKCLQWKHILETNPYDEVMGYSGTLAATLADIINSFVGPLSWKAMVVLVMAVVGTVVVSNLAFFQYRRSLDRELVKVD